MPFYRFRILLSAAAIALAGPLAAQEAPAPADAPAAETTPAAPEAPATPAPEADAGAAPAQEPEVMEVVRDTFGDWQVRCAPDGEECFLYQLALDGEKNPVAEVSLVKLPAGGEAVAGVTIVTPLGTLLTNGLLLQIDTGETRQYPFVWCSQVGCFSRFALAQTSIDAMKRGKTGKLTLVSIGNPQQPVILNLSLTGFTDAFNSLTVPEGMLAPAAAPVAPAAPAPKPAPAPLPSLMPKN